MNTSYQNRLWAPLPQGSVRRLLHITCTTIYVHEILTSRRRSSLPQNARTTREKISLKYRRVSSGCMDVDGQARKFSLHLCLSVWVGAPLCYIPPLAKKIYQNRLTTTYVENRSKSSGNSLLSGLFNQIGRAKLLKTKHCKCSRHQNRAHLQRTIHNCYKCSESFISLCYVLGLYLCMYELYMYKCQRVPGTRQTFHCRWHHFMNCKR